MSFSKAGSLTSLVDQYEKAFNEIQMNISKIPDEKTLKQIKTSFIILTTNGPKIEKQLDDSNDPNADALRNRYYSVASGFDSQKASWDSVIKKKETEFKKVREAEEAKKPAQPGMTEEQMQVMQQADELEYVGRQVEEIVTMQKDLNELTHKVDDKITEDHEKVVKIDNHIEDAKNEMIEGNKDLEHAEKDQKKCNIC